MTTGEVEKFCGFEDIKNPGLIERIRERLKAGIVEVPHCPSRCYTERELMDLTDKFIEVEQALDAGLPNEMQDMLLWVRGGMMPE